MWLEIFMLFSAMWWILSVATLVSLIFAISIEQHSGGWITFISAVYLACLILFGDFRPWETVVENPMGSLFCIGGYLVVGGIWAIIHWYIHCLNVRSEYNDELIEWLIGKGVPENSIGKPPSVPEHLKKEWTQHCSTSNKWSRWGNGEKKINIIPLIRDNKSFFTISWLMWPISMFWSIFDDLLRAVGRIVYELTSRWLQRISNLAFRGTENHFEQE